MSWRVDSCKSTILSCYMPIGTYENMRTMIEDLWQMEGFHPAYNTAPSLANVSLRTMQKRFYQVFTSIFQHCRRVNMPPMSVGLDTEVLRHRTENVLQ
jgi:hypothetical protein